uniref:Uncharacterized protein n=1 Tax=Trichogramma kaykai TaxID=54128 RepID=A0ABD2WB87_9HYME
MSETTVMWMLVLVMLGGSYLAGSLPLLNAQSGHLVFDKLQLVSVLGAGLLVGTALSVINPEGVRTLVSGAIHTSTTMAQDGAQDAERHEASASCLSATIYSVFLVPETIQIQHQRALKDVFDYKLVRDLFKAVLKSRDGFDKFLVWSCVLSIAINVSIMEGNGSILFLFTSYKLQWNFSDVSIYSGTNLLLTIIGMLLLIKLVGSILKLPETVIVVLSCLSTSISCLGKAFVSKPYHMYITAGIGMFSASAVPAIRSIVSKTVPQDDLGKTFSVITIVEMNIPFADTANLWKVLKNTQYNEIVTERD